MSNFSLRTTIPTEQGESRFVTKDIPQERDTPYGVKSEPLPVDGFYVRRVTKPTGNAKLADYHQAPEDQYVVQLKGGGIEVGSSEGQKHTIYPVSVGRVMDVTGRGHTSVPLSDQERISLFIPVRN